VDQSRTRLTAAGTALAALLVFFVYLTTMAPGLFWRDSAEFAMLGFNLDIGHPAGSPTFTMLSGLLARTPLGSIAFRANLISGLFGLLAVATVLWCATGIARRVAPKLDNHIAWAAGALAVSPMLFSPGYWYWAGAAEVYTGQIALLALLIGMTLKCTETDSHPPDFRVQLALAFILGLSCGLHMVMILYAPAFGIVLFLTRRSDFNPSRIAAFAAAFFVGASIFLLLPIRSATDPPFDYGNTETLSALLVHITGRQYGELLRTYPWHRIIENLGALAGHLRTHLSLPHLAFALAGLFMLARRSWRTVLLLAAIAIGHFYLYLRDWDDDFGYLTIYLLVALVASAGIAALVSRLNNRKATVAVLLIAAFATTGWQLASNRAYCDKSENDLLLRQTRAVLDSLPNDALLVSYEDHLNYASVYVQSIERWREDVVHFHRAYLDQPDYLHHRRPDLEVAALEDDRPYGPYRFLRNNAGDHPPFWDHGHETPHTMPVDRLAPWGRVTKVLDKPIQLIDVWSQKSKSLLDRTIEPIIADPAFGNGDWTSVEVTSRFFSNRSKYYFDRGDRYISQKFLERSIAMRPGFAPTYGQLAALEASFGNAEAARAAVENGLEIDPLDDFLWKTLGLLAFRQEDNETASDALSRSLDLNGAQPDVALQLARTFYKIERYDKAEKAARDALAYPSDPKTVTSATEMLARSLLRQGIFVEAEKLLARLVEENPEEEFYRKLLAVCRQAAE
jgi:tetratricopeptide (TPR) repeat protein